ncbi:MAG: nitrate reductase [Planctomycetes bacterium]|nr:nitrate reductase [Planctomycetota bacterium]
MAFKSLFIAIFIGTALIVAAMIVNYARPPLQSGGAGGQPAARFIRATGKCAECHRSETSSIVHQFEMSMHARRSVTCLDCHQPMEGQEQWAHSGFILTRQMTSSNCRQCHTTEYDQFVRSRHAAPAFAAVLGSTPFTDEQIALAEKYHPGTVLRPPNALAQREGEGVLDFGCLACHNIGKPNSDGSIGSCVHCHSRHATSVALARQPETCGQCHMGPDHAQLEIFNESKHGILWAHQKNLMNLSAPAKTLTTRDMPVPSCATCHMSGLEGQKVTHDVTERLSWWLFAPVSKKRPTYEIGQIAMKETCLKCHASTQVERFYEDAEIVVHATNDKVQAALDIVKALRDEGLLTPQPFDEPIEFLIFDIWHYFGRTAKHGAFMGGADFVQWHGNYELLLKMIELKSMAEELRSQQRNELPDD